MAYHSLGSICVTYETQSCSFSNQVLPTQRLPREAKEFSKGDKYSKNEPLPTYIDYLKQKVLVARFYLCTRSATENYTSHPLALNTLLNSYLCY